MNAHVDPAIAKALRPRDARNNPAVAAAWAEHVARRRRMMPAGPIQFKPKPRPYAPQPMPAVPLASEPKMVDFAEVLKQYREVTILARRADYPPIDLIIQATAVTFGVTYLDIVSDRRTMAVLAPRQVAMFLAKSLTPKSLPEIGRRIGHRDHSTVLHGYRKIAARVQADFSFAAEVASAAAEIAKRWRVAGAAP